jgi:hypothetical protein
MTEHSKDSKKVSLSLLDYITITAVINCFQNVQKRNERQEGEYASISIQSRQQEIRKKNIVTHS